MPSTPSTIRGDFPDTLSPLLVKELRQGLRSGIFVGVMVAIQALAAGIVALETVLRSFGGTQIIGSGGFWTLTGAAMCLGLPLSLLGALADEKEERKIELLVISGHSERRVCLEKWLSALARGLLIWLSLVPHMLARYLLALVELPKICLASGMILLIYAVVCAIVIGASAARTPWLRGWMIVYQLGGAFVCLSIAGTASYVASRLVKSGPGVGPELTVWQALFIAVYLLSVAVQLIITALKYGADKIQVQQRPYAPTGVNGFAILIFAMPMIYGVIALGSFGFGVPIIAGIIAWISWTSRN